MLTATCSSSRRREPCRPCPCPPPIPHAHRHAPSLPRVAQLGELHITTELGRLAVAPNEIAVIPRNVRFSVDPSSAARAAGGCRGYVCELYTGHYRLPDLGPIGANGLAEPRDFLYPVAWYEDRACEYVVTTKLLGELWDAPRAHSPYDVVGWHGILSLVLTWCCPSSARGPLRPACTPALLALWRHR